MDRWELDKFLRRITPFEAAIQNRQNLKVLKPLVRGEHSRKYPIFDNQDIVDNILSNANQGEAKLVFASEGISFCCHPRFLKTQLHSHSFVEMMYVYSGQCRQIINGIEVTMHQGEICIVDTNIQHLIEPTGENDIIINCLMSKSYLENILIGRLAGNDLFSSFFAKALYPNNDSNNYLIFSSGQSEKINQFMTYLLCESFNRVIWSDEVINSYMVLIFSELLSIHTSDINSQNYYVIKNIKLSDIILFIQENCNTATLAYAAEHFHFNPNYLSMMLKKLTGHNFTDILHQARLRKACLLLNNSSMAIAKIANSVGYQNVNFFYQIFKKHYGDTPAEYRKKG
ncbi:MAG: AraC-type DNA-binding protein [Firmicutes bacterium]|nr:AraC-type DNA-binding protein [Bacillota bacterium]